MLRLFLGALLRAAAPAFGFRLEVDEPQRHPDDLALVNGDRPLVVLARHAGPGASFALVHVLLGRWSRQVHVILKDTLRLDPAIDLLLSRTGCTWVPTSGGGAAPLMPSLRPRGPWQPQTRCCCSPRGRTGHQPGTWRRCVTCVAVASGARRSWPCACRTSYRPDRRVQQRRSATGGTLRS